MKRTMFSGSFKIGSVMGIPIMIHFSFLLILPFLAWAIGENINTLAGYMKIPAGKLSLSPYVLGFLIAIGLFASVVLHELGHSYIALRKGIKIRSITLMLFGGVAQLEEMPSKPGEEAKIALAGPVVSFIVGGVLLAILPMIGQGTNTDLLFTISYLGTINIFLGGFNLLPAFPMDGGRILRSVLAKWKPFVTATTIAANVGKVFAFAIGAAGILWGDFFLVLIAFFVYIGASQEHQFTVIKVTLDGVRVKDLMTSNVQTVSPGLPVAQLIDRMLQERHTGYPVMENGRLIGCVTQGDIEKISPEQRDQSAVKDIMSHEVAMIGSDVDAYLALKKMSESEIGRLPVVEQGKLVGIVSRTDILRGFKLRQLRTTS